VELSPKCRPSVVRRLLIGMLDAFNRGESLRFAEGFASEGFFQPYPGTFPDIAQEGLVGEAQIEAFVRERHEARDGWSATELSPPLGEAGVDDEAVYGMTLVLTSAGNHAGVGGAKVVIDCRSGLVADWVGPPQAPS
jgi:hypothetical protein